MREDLEKLLNIYAIEERCFSYVLQKHTILPALIDTGEEHIDFFDEWFYAKPHLVRLAENVSTSPAGATKAEARVICNRADFVSQVDGMHLKLFFAYTVRSLVELLL